MKGLAAALDDAAIKNLAAFFASQEPRQPDVRKPLTAVEWRKNAIAVTASMATAPTRACPRWLHSVPTIWRRR